MPDLTPIMLDASERRELIRQKVLEGLNESFPVKSRNKTLEVRDLTVEAKDYGSTEQKGAILKGNSLYETVKGTVRMRDEKGKVLDEAKNFTLVRIPYFTPRHTFIMNGNEYSVSNMVRRKPGVYARKRANGILEAAFNTEGGSNFRVSMDPEKGEPRLEYGTTKIPLYPILRKAGVSHQRISKAWGKKLADVNEKKLMPKRAQYLDKLYKKEVPEYLREDNSDADKKMEQILGRYSAASMDPNVNRMTLGTPYKNVTPDGLLDASAKVLNIFKQTDEVDDQDNLDFKKLLSVDDFFKERIKLYAREVSRKAAIKMESTPELRKAIPSAPFTKDLRTFLTSSQLSSIPTQVNPMELVDASVRVTSLGEGGISTERAIPLEARQTHVTQMGALDPIRTPESFRAGIDVRTAMLAQRDREGNIYVPVYDVKTRRRKSIRAGELQRKVIAFPEQELKGKVDAMVEGVIRKVPASKVDYQIPHSSYLYSPTTNLIPMMESQQGNRSVMASKMMTQAISLIDREPPYVQVGAPSGGSFEKMMGKMINPIARTDGTIAKIDKDFIYLRPDKEKTGAPKKKKAPEKLIKIPYDRNLPMAAKTYLDHQIIVKKGDRVRKGQLLANSNFTKDGTLALGKNMKVAYMPYYGANTNDAYVVSEDAAKQLTSERMYNIVIPRDSDLTFNRTKHKNYYGHGYTKDQYEALDDEGVIKPGTKIDPGNPVAVGLRKTEMSAEDMMLGRLHRSLAKPYKEFSNNWDHDHQGEVIDVVKTPKRIALTIKTKEPATIGDKIVGRFGNKGVISQIIPDDQMIKDENGNTIDILMGSSGVVGRINPNQIIETAVGKVVDKTGKPIIVPSFSGRNNVQWAKDLLKKHKVKDKETVYDPVSGKKIPKVFVGNQYIYKLFKSTDTNYSARGTGTYDVNEQPTKGGVESAKALGKMEFDALVAHNARNILRDSATLKSQRNDEVWRAMQLGYPTPAPKSSFAYDKFLRMLQGAGVKTTRNKSTVALSPLTDEDVLKMSSGEIKDSKIIKAKDLKPEAGGLFDPATTGGLRGQKWSHINLVEPVINPVFKEPVRRLLGMTNVQLNDTIKDKGGRYIKKKLAAIDVSKRERELLKGIKSRKGSVLDGDVKQVKYLRSLGRLGLTPDKAYMVSKVPVVPPVVRPIIVGKGGQQIIYGDTNPLYQDLIYINNQLKETKAAKVLPQEEAKLRSAVQEAVGAVYGTNEPVTAKSKARGHKGFLTYIAGVGSPKYGYFQSKLMKRSQDVAGRGTIVPDPTLDIDEVGLPKDMLWTMYDKFVIKRLVGNGYSALQAKKMVEEKHPAASEMLLQETRERPVLINRAPSLHRFSIIAAKPKPVPGKTIRVHPFVEKGQNADYDGDTEMVHVPVSPAAVKEANNLTLSNLLFGDRTKKDLMVFPDSSHEAIMGINRAATLDGKNAPKQFANKGDAMKAYNEGRIGLGTRIKVGS